MAARGRDIFGELVEGIDAMRAAREGKATLRTHRIDVAPLPKVDARTVRQTREQLGMSQRLFARTLRINPRTLERWEQGRSTPNEQAAVLIMLVRRYPDTVERIAKIGGSK